MYIMREIKVGTVIKPWVCEEASLDDKPEEPLYGGTMELKRNVKKCLHCAYRFRGQCKNIACMTYERKDGKSIVMVRL